MADVVWLEQAFRKSGLPIDVFPGAYDRGHGDMRGDKPFIHHTGSFGETARGIAQHPSLGLASQLYLSPQGKYTLCGVGIAWHAGTGSWQGIPTNDGNSWCLGIEAAHDGKSAWGKAQLDNYLKGIQVINQHRGKSWNDVVAHKEYGAIQGKWDPGNMDMKWVRQQLLKRDVEKPIVINMIELEAKQNPWVGVRHGKPGEAGEIRVGADGKGRFVEYDNAHIYFHPATGAFAIPHADPKLLGSGIFEAWAALGYERGPLGYPVRDFTKLENGAVMAFQGGVLYVQDAGVSAFVRGVIGQRWATEGYEKGPLGYPITNESPNGTGGVMQYFQHGILEWDPSGAVKKIGPDAVRDLTVVDDKGLPLAVKAVDLIAA